MEEDSMVRGAKRFAAQIRLGIVEELEAIGSGHMGGSLSIADALAVLYGAVMRYDPQDPSWEDRDKLVLSKGHAGPALYAALAIKGFFPYGELVTINTPHTRLPSHVDRTKTPGVDMTAGSLGQGASAAVGIALGDKLKGRDSRTYLITGDGELDEGQCWEAAMFASAKGLDDLVWLVDYNRMQLDGPVDAIIPHGDLAARFRAFGFAAVAVDGGDVKAIYDAVTRRVEGKPSAVILNTVKGRGIADVEAMKNNHSITVSHEQAEKWRSELRALIAELD